MKKLLIAIMIMTATLSAEMYDLSERITVEKRTMIDSYFVDKCIGTQVWRLYIGGYQGSLTQVTVSWTGRSIPLICADYDVFATLNGIRVK